MSRQQRLGLRARLALVIAGAMLPLLLFCLFLLAWTSELHRRSADRGLTDVSHALALAVDRQLAVWIAALETLGTADTLARGDLTAFYRQALTVARRYDGWVVLFDADAQQRVNTLRPFGAELPRAADPARLQELLAQGRPRVSGLTFGRVAQRWVIAVEVPVSSGGVTYGLNLSFEPAVLSNLLAAQDLPPGWLAVVIDGNHRVVARSRDAAAYVAREAPAWYAAAIAEGRSEGLLEGVALDGRPVRLAFARIGGSPWTLAVAQPTDERVRVWRWPILALAGAALVAVLLAVGSAAWLGRRITRPILDLAAFASALMRGEDGNSPRSGVPELDMLRDAIDRAAALRHAAEAERERAVVAEARAAEREMMLRELRHRVKNNLQLVSALLSLDVRRVPPEARPVFENLSRRVHAIIDLHRRLESAGALGAVDLGGYVEALCRSLAVAEEGRGIRIEARTAASLLAEPDTALRVGLITVELVTNAAKHAYPPDTTGTIEVRLSGGADRGELLVVDRGMGMPTADAESGTGLGMRIVRSLAAQLGGELAVEVDGGTKVRLTFPVASEFSAVLAARGRTSHP